MEKHGKKGEEVYAESRLSRKVEQKEILQMLEEEQNEDVRKQELN